MGTPNLILTEEESGWPERKEFSAIDVILLVPKGGDDESVHEFSFIFSCRISLKGLKGDSASRYSQGLT